MPPKLTLTVADWLRLTRGLYRLRVVDVDRDRGGPGLKLVLEHIDAPNRGRQHHVMLELPVRPDNLTARFFKACGQSTEAGQKLHPKQCVGKAIGVRFRPGTDGQYVPETFEAVHQEGSDEHPE